MWLAAELEGDPRPCAGPYSFGEGRTILRQAGTSQGTEACLGADTFGGGIASERRLRKDGCHASLNFLRVLKEFRYRVYF